MRPLLLLTALLIAISGYGQKSPADSIMTKQVRAAFFLTNTDPDSALVIGKKGVEQSKLSGNRRLAAYAYKTRGWALFRMGNYDSSFVDLFAATKFFEELHDTVETLYMYVNLANVYSNHSQFTESATYLMKADSLAKIKKDVKIEAGIKRQMGIFYRQQGQYAKAISQFKESLVLYESINDTLNIWDASSSLSITYNQFVMKPDSSLSLLKKCEPLLNATPRPTYQKASMQEQFGDAYYAMTDYDKALGRYHAAYTMFAGQGDKADMYYEAMNVGRANLHLKNYGEAEKYLLQAYKGNDSLGMTNYALDASRELASLYKNKQDWQKAFHWLETTSRLSDSLQLADQNKKTAEFQAKYEGEKKDAEISLLKKGQEVDRLTMQKQKTFRYGAAALLILLALIGLLFINRYRIVQRAKRQVEMERLRNNIARDLHDDMGSTLSSINIISKVALENPGERDNIRECLKKIQDNSGYMMESMSDIVWAINPVNDSFEKVIFKMKEFAADILEPLNIKYEFRQSGDPLSIQMGLNKRKDLYLIFKEAINNAAKYSSCTKVTIIIQMDNDEITLRIADDGRGFDTGNGATGNGIRNMKQRAKEMGGNVTISGENGKGTTVLLKIKPHDQGI